MEKKQEILRSIPKMDELLLDEQLVFFYGIDAESRGC